MKKYGFTRPKSQLSRFIGPSLLIAVAFANIAVAQTSSTSGNSLHAESPQQSGQHAEPPKLPAVPEGVSYKDGQLTINALNVSLYELLTKVAAATGIKIDIPFEANVERIPMVNVGPGSAREVLASLLRDTHFNFLIADSDTDPSKLQSVLILPLDQKDGNSRPGSRSPVYGPASTPERAAVTDSALGNDAAGRGADNASLAPPPEGNSDSANAPAPEPPEMGTSASLAASAQAELAKASSLRPPPVLNQESINTQLQQMYQQRMQMIQQGKPQSPTVGTQ